MEGLSGKRWRDYSASKLSAKSWLSSARFWPFGEWRPRARTCCPLCSKLLEHVARLGKSCRRWRMYLDVTKGLPSGEAIRKGTAPFSDLKGNRVFMSGTSAPLRVVLAKVGLDGHDRGIKIVA